MKKQPNNPKVKILVAYNKPTELLKNDVFQPIHVGRDIAKSNITTDEQKQNYQWMIDNLIGDDTGDNISAKNPNYCELTAQYWAWKNLSELDNPDYIGFMHYRRHLNFNVDKEYNENKWGTIDNNYLDGFYIEKYGLNEENIKNVVGKYDIITVNPWNVKNAGSKNNYDHYATSDPKIHIKDYDLTLKILQKKYPEYKTDIKKYNESAEGYYTNIFIMKKDIFNQYCQWLFDILFEVEKEVDISNYDFQEARIFGYLSEWLFGIYMTHIKRTTKLKVKELQRTIVHYVDLPCDINICFATDDNYAKYMGIAITSILRHKSESDNINIYVLDGGISQKNKIKIAKLQNLAKFNITFIKMNDNAFKNYPLRGNPHFTYATYYRLLLPTLLPNVDKLIYLDCDLIVRSSLSTLMNENMYGNLCKGVIDVLNFENQTRLHLDKYVNAGVLLIDLKKWRENKVETKFKTYLKKHFDEILWNDQDVINAVLKGKIDYIDPRWNTQLTEYKGGRTEEFRKIGKKAYIMHFISNKKPWKFCKSKYEKYYFQEAIHSPWKDGWAIHIVNKLTERTINFAKILFSSRNSQSKKYKIITIFGVRIKFKRKLYPLECKIKQMQQQIYELNQQIKQLSSNDKRTVK